MQKQALLDYQEFNNEKFTKRIIFKEGESTVFVLNFEPGQKLPAHKHPGTNVYLLVLQGEGTLTIDGNEVPIVKDDVVLCGGEEEFAFANGSSNTSLYVMLNKIPDDRYAQNI
ncbi:cupin domain-containing protein [Calidifontibacillus oryziterrae]|uniref:cupin domain-containing protein n=1 Tax=Calidifontibacillus oryziterrae TaxID=1191699 RepID=UPI0002E5DC77|nr:cupin domain-containing protein [Calidifontibacillus oryziterrae]